MTIDRPSTPNVLEEEDLIRPMTASGSGVREDRLSFLDTRLSVQKTTDLQASQMILPHKAVASQLMEL